MWKDSTPFTSLCTLLFSIFSHTHTQNGEILFNYAKCHPSFLLFTESQYFFIFAYLYLRWTIRTPFIGFCWHWTGYYSFLNSCCRPPWLMLRWSCEHQHVSLMVCKVTDDFCFVVVFGVFFFYFFVCGVKHLERINVHNIFICVNCLWDDF